MLDRADWIDGRVTAGHQSVRAKNNMQVPENSPLAQELGDLVLKALERNALFITAALPLRVFPPLFNKYRDGESFGTHVDNAIRQVSGGGVRIRTDLSATLFLALVSLWPCKMARNIWSSARSFTSQKSTPACPRTFLRLARRFGFPNRLLKKLKKFVACHPSRLLQRNNRRLQVREHWPQYPIRSFQFTQRLVLAQ